MEYTKPYNLLNFTYSFIFSPHVFFTTISNEKKSFKAAWLLFFIILAIFLTFYISIFPALTDIMTSIFQENNIEYSNKTNGLIQILLIILGVFQFVSTTLVSFFILHIAGILFGGKGKPKAFFSNYIFATVPMGIKFFILTLFSFIIGSEFSLSFIISVEEGPISTLIDLIIDPFFWWSTVLGCIALKESHSLSYSKSIIIMVILFSIGVLSVLSVSLI